MIYPFMSVVADCLEATKHDDWFVQKVRTAFAAIAAERPDLVDRYDHAFPRRSAGEIERLLRDCLPMLEQHDVCIDHIRVNAVTRRFHVGDGHGSVPLFPYLQGI